MKFDVLSDSSAASATTGSTKDGEPLPLREAMGSYSGNTTENRELAFLVEHMKTLENEQRANPDSSAEEKIRMIRETILDMLRRLPLEALFVARRPEDEVHDEIHFIMRDLQRLEEEQRRHPTTVIADRLRSIRSTIENL